MLGSCSAGLVLATNRRPWEGPTLVKTGLVLVVFPRFTAWPVAVLLWLGSRGLIFVFILHRKMSDAVCVGETIVSKMSNDLQI